MGECHIMSLNSHPELSTKLNCGVSGLSLFRLTPIVGRQVIYPFFSLLSLISRIVFVFFFNNCEEYL